MHDRQTLSKAFPVIMDINTEVGQDVLMKNIRRFFQKGTIPVVCPDCGTKNYIDIDSIEKHMKDRGSGGEEFDDCIRCGRSLVFESQMGPKRKPDPPPERKVPRSRAEHLKKVVEELPKVIAPPKVWNAKRGVWEDPS